jgi:hypothetical protein
MHVIERATMRSALRPMAGIALLTALIGAAAAEEIELFPEGTFDTDPRAAPKQDDQTDAEEKALRSAMHCDRYGPDYVLVEGTTTCIRASGYIQLDVYTRRR